MCQGGKPDTGKLHSSYIGMNVCGSTYENGCVVDGMSTSELRTFLNLPQIREVPLYNNDCYDNSHLYIPH